MSSTFDSFNTALWSRDLVFAVHSWTTRGSLTAVCSDLSLLGVAVFRCVMWRVRSYFRKSSHIFLLFVSLYSSSACLTTAALPRQTGFSVNIPERHFLRDRVKHQCFQPKLSLRAAHLRVCASAAARRSASGRSRRERTVKRAPEASSASECAAGARTEHHLSINSSTNTSLSAAWCIWTYSLHTWQNKCTEKND